MEIDFTLEQLDSVAREFFLYTSGNKIFTFTGELGAGKTTLIGALCNALGVQEKVTSPTYSLIQEYLTNDKQIIYHMDFYRINSLYEAVDAGAEECIFSGEYCMIEWPAKIEDLLPHRSVHSRVTVLDESLRKLVVQLP